MHQTWLNSFTDPGKETSHSFCPTYNVTCKTTWAYCGTWQTLMLSLLSSPAGPGWSGPLLCSVCWAWPGLLDSCTSTRAPWSWPTFSPSSTLCRACLSSSSTVYCRRRWGRHVEIKLDRNRQTVWQADKHKHTYTKKTHASIGVDQRGDSKNICELSHFWLVIQ